MMDNQWPRWEVFKQDSTKKPYQAVGSVHAADPEHALLNARNVFVRRPSAVGLWVAKVDNIFSRTQEELEKNPLVKKDIGEQTAVSYHIFRKSSHRRSMTFMDHIGVIEETSAENALDEAIKQFGSDSDLAWWVIEDSAIAKSEPGLEDAWFAPAKTKTYKQQSQYGFVRIKEKK